MDMFQHLIDFGLVVLIWMVQLVVYPSFTYYQPEDLLKWHTKYTLHITVIVMPLMSLQLLWHAYALYHEFDVFELLGLVLIVIVWANTFLVAVPLHDKISRGKEITESSYELIRINWYRTLLWTLIFLLGFF